MSKKYKVLIALLIVFIFLGYISVRLESNEYLKIYFLNVGQGDAIFIEAPNGKQILIDGGPDKSVMRELGNIMPIYDKKIDMIVITNPDKDHIAGFAGVLEKYKVTYALVPGTRSNTVINKNIESQIDENGISKIKAMQGMKILLDIDRNIFIEVIFPDRDVSNWKTNDGSILMRLSYSDTSVLLTGDMPAGVERYLLQIKADLDSDILKVAHHGSKTSTTKEFVKAVSPQISIISSGRNNRYGHPHKEVLDTLNSANIEVLRTDTQGSLIFQSDGKKWSKKVKKTLIK